MQAVSEPQVSSVQKLDEQGCGTIKAREKQDSALTLAIDSLEILLTSFIFNL